MKENHLRYRLVLLGALAGSIAIDAFSLAYAFINKPSDMVLVSVVLIVLSLFTLFEIAVTLINIKKPLALKNIAITMRDKINYIPLIAVGIGTFLATVFLIVGIVFFCIKPTVAIRSSSLVLFSVGFYLVVNCIFYIMFVLSYRRN